MIKFKKIGDDTTLPTEGGFELEGICKGIICTPLPRYVFDIGCDYQYEGIFQRANGELFPFKNTSKTPLESVIAKTSSETGMPVKMQAVFDGKYLLVFGLKLGNIKSEEYQEQ